MDIDDLKANINGEYSQRATQLIVRLLNSHTKLGGIYREENNEQGFTAENLKYYAAEYLGITDFEPYSGEHLGNGYSYDGTYYQIYGRGDVGVAVSYDEHKIDEEAGTVTVTMHAWADLSKTVKAQTTRFVLGHKDGDIRILSYELVEDTGLDIAFGTHAP